MRGRWHSPTIAFQATALPMVARLAERDLGIAITPASTTGASLRTLPDLNPPLTSGLEFAWNPVSPSTAARVLVEQAPVHLSSP